MNNGTRPKNSRVRHGMASCARYGCTRRECLDAYNRTRKLLQLNTSRGIYATVPASRAEAHVRQLIHAGRSPIEISTRSGISERTILNLSVGRLDRIYRDTEAAVLGVTMPPPGYRPTTDGLMDATAARRRLRALSARGFTLTVLAAEVGVTSETIGRIRQHRADQVRISINRDIADAYDRLWNADPLHHGATLSGSVRARKWALRQGWAPPAAWDDETIADPDAQPHMPESDATRARIVAEDARWLLTNGHSRDTAAARLGISRFYLDRSLREHPQHTNDLEPAA